MEITGLVENAMLCDALSNDTELMRLKYIGKSRFVSLVWVGFF